MTVEVLHRAEGVQAMVGRLADRIAADHPEGLVVVGVLNAAVPFMADLVRGLPDTDVAVDFLAVSSFRPDSGQVRLVKDLDLDIGDRDVVLVSTLIDTGLRLAYLRGRLLDRAPRTLKLCTLFDKAERRILPVPLDYVGTTVPDRYLIGYGLDHHGRFRNLSQVVTAEVATAVDDPDLVGLLTRADR